MHKNQVYYDFMERRDAKHSSEILHLKDQESIIIEINI